MGLFSNMKTDNLEQSEDRLGGGVQAVATDVYEVVIKNMYAGASEGGAQNVTVIADVGGKEVRETVYITKKTGEHYYYAKDDTSKSKKLPLPGFSLINDICLLTTGNDLSDQETAEKVVKIYNFQERKEVPTPVPVLVNTIGKRVLLGISRVIEPTTRADDSGKRVPQYDDNGALKKRTINTINKAYDHSTRRTVNEVIQGIEKPEFIDAWLERFKGKDDDSAIRGLEGGAAGGPGASGSGRPQAAGGGGEAAPKKKLFPAS